jgi:dihydrofolate synthase/folylpolyglutamate synthase
MRDDGYQAELRLVEAEITARWGEGRMHPTTERIDALVDLLGEPQRAYRSVHLTGTNGKTSTARMTDELVRAFGPRTGRFTSPHLSQITERIVIDGEPISARTFVDGYRELKPYIDLVDARFGPSPDRPDGVALSFFEVMVALAYALFADAPIDVAVVEVGLGGRWDATNVIDADVAVVTPVDLDHTRFLGDTVEKIAAEKAGIIKPGSVAILAAQQPEAAAELLRHAAGVEASVAREGLEFGVLDRQVAVGGQVLRLQGLGGTYDDVFLPLYGAHQAQNAVCALAAAEALLGVSAASGTLDVDVVRSAFAAVRSPGRLEAVRSAPTVLVDAAHNPHAMAATLAAIDESFDFHGLVAVLAVLGDKDVTGMLELLEPQVDELVVSQNGSLRAVPADELAALAVPIFGAERVSVSARLDDAITDAVQLAEAGGAMPSRVGVLVTGSVVTAGEARTLLTGAA